MGCDAGMTSRRLATWWRLLLALGLLAAPLATAVAASPSGHVVARHVSARSGIERAVAVAGTSPVSAAQRSRHVHRAAPMVAAVAAPVVALVVLVVCSGAVRRRESQLAGAARRWWSSRAPPKGTGSLVPFGQSSDGVGRFSRSPRALFPGPIPNNC